MRESLSFSEKMENHVRNRDMRSNSFMMVPLSLLAWMVISQPVKAERVCQVTDPTGTPLNVRDRPNGQVVNALRNGREVYIHETAYDRQGRPWVLVGGYYKGVYRTWGWVFREFVSCYNR
ncbi:hypothetical protein myaer87_09820 [Microcystis aeruginosa NIES-87]|jgi:hypothetical protein|uniref:SH3b domain-containing protein n=4 Tax=Microcystis aeruginosa TaxID=1126 RepID=A0A9P2YMZ6_MICAE|nr:hypothetical protein BGM30_41480 [Microcystis aeruginosa NIES-298]GBE73755.1 hypothetical protein myaer87_09820 [Microcystis aeruginosa NIES-87]